MVGITGKPPKQGADNANPYFPPAFLRILRAGRPVLLLFSGTDRLYAEFQEKFLAVHQSALEPVASVLDVVVVADANHVFTFAEWQIEMLRCTREWLLTRFPARRDAAGATAPVAEVTPVL
jgi:hypothetical protein